MRIALSGIDGSGKTTLSGQLEQWLSKNGRQVRVIGNLPRAYRSRNNGVIDPTDPFLSSFFFNYAAVHTGHPGAARFLFDARYLDYVMVIEEARLYHDMVTVVDATDIVIHDRHVLDRRVNAYRAGCPRHDIDLILDHIPPPHLTVLLDLPAEVAVERVAQRGRPGQDENVADLAEYRQVYRTCAAMQPNTLVVDATIPTDEVFEIVLPHIRELIS